MTTDIPDFFLDFFTILFYFWPALDGLPNDAKLSPEKIPYAGVSN
jgi:hypothetical protein